MDYVKAVVKKLEERPKKKVRKLPASATTPMSYDYIPYLDATEELDSNNIIMFYELIGYMRCSTEIGRVETLHEVLVLSAFQEGPRERHLH